MQRAQRRDAVLKQKFWWRRDIKTSPEADSPDQYAELTIDEIVNGKVCTRNHCNNLLIFHYKAKVSSHNQCEGVCELHSRIHIETITTLSAQDKSNISG